MSRPTTLLKDGTLYWVMRLYDPADGVTLIDADSTPTVAVRKNGSAVGDSVTVGKRSATTGIYDCSYNPASEIEGDQFTIEESATIGAEVYPNSWEFGVKVAEGSAGSNPEVLTDTTIATLATQTSFTLTAGSADDDAYNGCYAIITDQSTPTQKAVVAISDYVGSTKTVTLGAAACFTVAAGDSIEVIGVNLSGSTVGTVLNPSAGGGPFVVTITVVDEDDNEVQSAMVRLTRVGQARYSQTEADGVVVLGCVAATWIVAIDADGFQFEPVTLEVSADAEITYELDRTSIDPPAAAGLATGYIDCYRRGVLTAGIIVRIQQKSGAGDSGKGWDDDVVDVTSDVDGRASYDSHVQGGTYRARIGNGPWKQYDVPLALDFAIPELVGKFS